MVECVDHPEVCDRAEKCTTRKLWGKVKGAMNSVLESITLKDLAEQ